MELVKTSKLKETEDVIQEMSHINSWLFQKTNNTRRAYKKDILSFFESESIQSVDEITIFSVSKYLMSLKEGGARNATLVRHRASISSLCRYLVKVGVLNKNPTESLDKISVQDNTTYKVLSLDVVKRMIELEPSTRNKLILKTFIKTGVRVSELSNLKVSSLKKRDSGFLLIVLGKGNKVRTITIGERLHLELLSYIELNSGKPSDPIFTSRYGKKISTVTIFKLVREAAIRAGINDNVSPHWLRHTHATIALENGADLRVIQETLGHESISTTTKYAKVGIGVSSCNAIDI